MMKCREAVVFLLRNYPTFFWRDKVEPHKTTLIRVGGLSGRDSNLGTPDYEAGVMSSHAKKKISPIV
jgi:hypothetical protein